MSNRKSRQLRQRNVSVRRGRKKYITLGAIALMVTVSLGTVFGPWRASFGAHRLRSLFIAPAPPPLPGPAHPSKEYIYAGGKLVATEEPQPSALAAPINLAANTQSDTQSAPQINITWTASSGADHYQVERADNITSQYATIAQSVSGTSFTDSGFTSVAAYLYRVRAVGSNGNSSPPSNIDLATAITFTDPQLTAGSTFVRAQHLLELRQAVDAVRAAANLSAVGWTDGNLVGAEIMAVHLTELRTNLDQALTVIGIAPAPYSDPTPSGVLIRKDHIDEIRQRVK
jgi:chitodextrinase